MGRYGPPPKPVALRLLEGNPSKRPLPEGQAAPEIGPDAPDPPAHLDEVARVEWLRLYGPLRACGLLTTADLSGFAVYCSLYSHWVRAEENLARTSCLIRDRDGTVRQNPWLRISRNSAQLMRGYMIEFGMTPAARARMAQGVTDGSHWPDPADMDDQPGKGTKFEGLIGKRPI